MRTAPFEAQKTQVQPLLVILAHGPRAYPVPKSPGDSGRQYGTIDPEEEEVLVVVAD